MPNPVPIRVILKWIQITDNLELGSERQGEFVFTAKVGADDETATVTRLPKEGSWFISEKPGKNRVRLNEILFEGEVEDRLVVELSGAEQDRFSEDDSLQFYRREFSGPVSSWIGLHGPGDEDEDPEHMANWMIGYEIVQL